MGLLSLGPVERPPMNAARDMGSGFSGGAGGNDTEVDAGLTAGSREELECGLESVSLRRASA